MNVESLRTHCLKLKGAEECLPFGPDTLGFKVGGKIFALVGLENAERVNLKCDPERSIDLRERYPKQVIPAYHMNKKHWNTVYFSGPMSEELMLELIEHSYELVVRSLSRVKREELGLKL